jgi:hypothetical protein
MELNLRKKIRRKIRREGANMNSKSNILVLMMVVSSFALGFSFGHLKSTRGIEDSLSADILRSMKDEEIVQVVTTVKFKKGVLVEIAPFKTVK